MPQARRSATPPRGRDATKRALVDAAASLFSEQGPARVGVREIAEKAGVNHGLVHRHFGSKDGLLKATLDDLASRIRQDVRRLPDAKEKGPREDLIATFQKVFEAVSRHPTYFRVLAQALLDGHDPRQLQSSFPLAKSLVGLSGRAARRGLVPRGLDAKMAVAMMISSALGWLMFEPYALAATGQDGLDRETVQQRFQQTWLTVATLVTETHAIPDRSVR